MKKEKTPLNYSDSSSIYLSASPVNAMTIDVEDYYQVSAFENIIAYKDWDNYSSRVECNTYEILELLDKNNTKATFFTLAWVAKKYPGLVKDICTNGHELASHGMRHVRVIHQTPDEFRRDVLEAKNILEDISGVRVNGYRAASYSISMQTLWAHDILEEVGYKYSSSVYPIKHDLYGIPDAPRFAFKPNGSELIEIPITTIEFMNKRFPCGGGGFFRLYPYLVTKAALININKKENQPTIFYFHPWEIDSHQPKIQNISLKTKIRHYLNLARTKKRLSRLLADFKWGRMDEIFIPESL